MVGTLSGKLFFKNVLAALYRSSSALCFSRKLFLSFASRKALWTALLEWYCPSAVDGFVGMVLPNIMDLLIQLFDAVIGFAQRSTACCQFVIGCFEGRLQFFTAVIAVLLDIAKRFRCLAQIAERYLSRIGGTLLGFQIALQIHNQIRAACTPAVFAFLFCCFP